MQLEQKSGKRKEPSRAAGLTRSLTSIYGKIVCAFIYPSDTRKRYVHICSNAVKAAVERSRVGEKIRQMQKDLDKHRKEKREFGPTFHQYFYLHYDKESGNFVYEKPRLEVIQAELDMCGYFAAITSEKMDAREAITLYKNRDASEKVFRADKSCLGNGSLRVASEEAASNMPAMSVTLAVLKELRSSSGCSTVFGMLLLRYIVIPKLWYDGAGKNSEGRRIE